MMAEEEQSQIVPAVQRGLELTVAKSALIARGRRAAATLVAVADVMYCGFSMNSIRRLAFHGNPDAAHFLAEFFYGHSHAALCQSDSDTLRWCRNAAEHGPVEECGDAHYWYIKAAEHGQMAAQNKLALLYEDGDLGPHNEVEVARWYRAAAELGDMECQYHLGRCYHEGIGVAIDYHEAAKWYRKAADCGAIYAQMALGVMYYAGVLHPAGERDYVHAFMWFSLGNWTNVPDEVIKHVESLKDLRSLEALMTQQQIAEAKRLTAAWKRSPDAGDDAYSFLNRLATALNHTG
jgi:hypothetical protein